MSMKPTIIPIAGGKGGIGKSVITSNLAISLAKMGYPTIVVDLDLGGSNLHTLLGHQNRYPSIGDFLMKKDKNLVDYLVESEWPALQFIAGDGRTPFMANINAGHKAKLVRQLKKLPARYVLLDLGAGSSYNTMDFFRISPTGLVVGTPERPALMNLMTFLKNAIFRSIEQFTRDRAEVQAHIKKLFAEPMTSEKLTMPRLLAEIEEIDPTAIRTINKVCREFRPRLVLNMAQQSSDLEFLNTVSTILHDVLNIQAEHFGFIFEDPVVRESVRAGKPLLEYAPDSMASQGINHLAIRLARMWKRRLPNSEEGLRRYVAKFNSLNVDRKKSPDVTQQAQDAAPDEVARDQFNVG